MSSEISKILETIQVAQEPELVTYAPPPTPEIMEITSGLFVIESTSLGYDDIETFGLPPDANIMSGDIPSFS